MSAALDTPAIRAVRGLTVTRALWRTALDELPSAGATPRSLQALADAPDLVREEIVATLPTRCDA